MSDISISLTVKDGFAALDFYEKALGAKVLFKLGSPEVGLFHGEFKLDGTLVYISGEAPDFHAIAMPEGQMNSLLINVEKEDPDGAWKRAVDAGAKSLSEPQDYFWGTRSAVVLDPYGYRWCFNKVIEDLSYEELERRSAEIFGQG